MGLPGPGKKIIVIPEEEPAVAPEVPEETPAPAEPEKETVPAEYRPDFDIDVFRYGSHHYSYPSIAKIDKALKDTYFQGLWQFRSFDPNAKPKKRKGVRWLW